MLPDGVVAKFVPPIVTRAPTGPDTGLTPKMAGAAENAAGVIMRDTKTDSHLRELLMFFILPSFLLTIVAKIRCKNGILSAGYLSNQRLTVKPNNQRINDLSIST